MNSIVLGYNNSYYHAYGAKLPVLWDYKRFAHALVCGATGSGKTYAVKLLLARIGLHIENASIFICDYKADDFKMYSDCKNYYEFDDCGQGLDDFFAKFQARQKGDSDRSFMLLCFDEWASYLNNLDRKEVETRKKQLSTLLMLGRSFNVHCLVSQQKCEMKYFESARNNFLVILGMGNIDKESRQMLFSGFDKEEMPPLQNIGEGYVLMNGVELISIKIPRINNAQKMEHYIRLALNR
jgi:hypothetical protein